MIKLIDLPYETKALEPHISSQTLEFHHDKHQAAYVNNLNDLVKGSELETLSLKEIIKKVANDPAKIKIFNNAAQVFNHEFYWQSLKSGTVMSAEIQGLLIASFGSIDNFFNEFKTIGLNQFGSGWIWLLKGSDKLEIIKTANADTPIIHNQKPLLTIDVWEHAYYLDYQNRRADYLEMVIKNLLNWEFVAKNLE